jgi:hypothetical protein
VSSSAARRGAAFFLSLKRLSKIASPNAGVDRRKSPGWHARMGAGSKASREFQTMLCSKAQLNLHGLTSIASDLEGVRGLVQSKNAGQ